MSGQRTVNIAILKRRLAKRALYCSMNAGRNALPAAIVSMPDSALLHQPVLQRPLARSTRPWPEKSWRK